MARTCYICGASAEYDDLPDGTVVYLGVCCCGECIGSGEAADFRALIEVEEIAFVDEMELLAI